MLFEKQIAMFESISLSEMDEVKLMNRADTKFVLAYNQLGQLLETIAPDYRILEVNGVRSSRYKTLYFDTDTLEFYINHQNEKRNRYKVRYRKYIESDLCFVEIKFKNNKGRTIKSRLQIDDFEESMSPQIANYVHMVSGIEAPLHPVLCNSFNRLTLVNKTEKERVTIDYNLQFEFGDKSVALQNVVIAELKQERANRLTSFPNAAKTRLIRPVSISKYCIGSALLNKKLKANNFKEKILTLNKIENGLVA